jgi:hypothetical protein
MAGVTNRGKLRLLQLALQNAALPGGGFAVALVTAAVAPTADTDLLSDLTEIAAGNGYVSGGQNVNRDATDFDVATEDDVNDRAFVQIKDISWTASGGTIPASGAGARYAVLTDRNPTVASREVYAFWDLGGDKSIANGQALILQDLEIRGTEV